MELRDYFREELAYIKALAKEHAQENPDFDQFVHFHYNAADVESLFEHFAFLTAKLRQKLDDSFPQLTYNLLSRVWPTPIRPIPSSAILHFTPKNNAEIHFLDKQSKVDAAGKDNAHLRFSLARPLYILPLDVIACYVVNSPDSCQITLKIKWLGEKEDKEQWKTCPISFYLGSDEQLAGQLLLWFHQYLTKVKIITNQGTWGVSTTAVKPFISDENNLVLPLEVNQYWRLQLLQEYFHLPHVNDFFTLDLTSEMEMLPLNEEGEFSVVFQFNQPLYTTYPITQSCFQVNCVPVINLFNEVSSSIEFEDNKKEYYLPEIPEKNIFSIDRVYSISTPIEWEYRGYDVEYPSVNTFSSNNVYSEEMIYHQEIIRENIVGRPVHLIRFINGKGDCIEQMEASNFVADLTLTNGERCHNLGVGSICLPSAEVSSNLAFKNISAPSMAIPLLSDSAQHWSIISHLSLSPSFLHDLGAIKQLIMDLYFHASRNIPDKKRIERQLKGLTNVKSRSIDWVWGSKVRRGIEMTLECDVDCFIDKGEMYRLGSMLSQVLPFCLSNNNFLMMSILSSKTGEMWSIEPIEGSRNQF